MPTVSPAPLDEQTVNGQHDWWSEPHPVRLAVDSLSRHVIFQSNGARAMSTGIPTGPYSMIPQRPSPSKDLDFEQNGRSMVIKTEIEDQGIVGDTSNRLRTPLNSNTPRSVTPVASEIVAPQVPFARQQVQGPVNNNSVPPVCILLFCCCCCFS